MPTETTSLPPKRRGEPRSRKLLAALAIIFGLIAYAFAVVILRDALPNTMAVDMILYPIAGLVWVWPAARLARWANRE